MSARDTLSSIVRQWAEQQEAAAETLDTLIDAFRVEVLREVADAADPAAPEVSWFGKYGPQVAAWLRTQAGKAAEDAAKK